MATDGNRWQMGASRKRLRKAKTVAVGCHRLPEEFHGKEGVDGSSPSEACTKALQMGILVLPAMAKFRRFAGTRRVHFGTGGHSRARAASRGTAKDMLETVARDDWLGKLLQIGVWCCPCWREADHLLG